jgi:CRP/FNR family transcriptional regulator, cyclic AMP receptor protein
VKTLEPLLAAHPFLAGLEPRAVSVLVGCASNVVFPPGDLLFKEGDPANRFYILREGDAAVELHVPGRGTMTIATVTEGEILGWSWLIPPHRCAFTVRAVTRVRAIAFDAACLRGKCEEDHDLGYELLKRFAAVMADRLQAARLQLLDLYASQ